MDLFLLKKVFSALVMPINVVLILLVSAIFLFKKRPRTSFKCLISAVLILTFSCIPYVSDTFMTSIENNYPAYTKSSQPVDYIIVLGSGHVKNDSRPVTIQFSENALQRFVEAVRIYKLYPEARIITSGFPNNTKQMKKALMLFGVPESKIITENYPKDTEEEAQLIAPRVIGTNVILITNADHMPRAMKYFEHQGVYPIAAPASYWVKNMNNPKGWNYYVPSSKKLEQTTVAWYETLGRFVQWLNELL